MIAIPDYEGYESAIPSSQLESYRKMLNEKTRPQTDFIQSVIGEVKHAWDLCCGNGRNLISLHRYGSLVQGIGVDLSSSRIAFAQRWASDLGIKECNIHFREGNVLSSVVGGTDLVMIITGAFQYFIHPEATMNILGQLRQGRTALLELYRLPESVHSRINSGEVVTAWKELPPPDPYNYILDSFESGGQKDVVKHTKRFISDTLPQDTRVEYLRYYTLRQMNLLMKQAGFKRINFYGDWDMSDYTNDSDKMIVVAS